MCQSLPQVPPLLGNKPGQAPERTRTYENVTVRGASGAAVRALELLAGMGLAALVTASTAFAYGNPLLPALPAIERGCATLRRARSAKNSADLLLCRSARCWSHYLSCAVPGCLDQILAAEDWLLLLLLKQPA